MLTFLIIFIKLRMENGDLGHNDNNKEEIHQDDLHSLDNQEELLSHLYENTL